MINDVYIKVRSGADKDMVREKIRTSYQKEGKTRFIFDVTEARVSIDDMKTLKRIFDSFEELTRTKLEETCVILEGELKKKVIKTFLASIKKVRPVKIL